MNNMKEIDNMTIAEYKMRVRAKHERDIKQEYDMHLAAYLNHVVQGTKTVGKKTVPLFPKFKDFYDIDKRREELIGVKVQQAAKAPRNSTRAIQAMIAANSL